MNKSCHLHRDSAPQNANPAGSLRIAAVHACSGELWTDVYACTLRPLLNLYTYNEVN